MALKNGNWKVYISIGVTLLIMGGGWLVTWGQTLEKMDTLSAQVELNRVARDTTLQLEPRVANIEKSVDEIKIAMKEGFREIMIELGKIKDESR